MDPQVIDLPLALRWPLVHWGIIPFRVRKSANAYQKIWRRDGQSPLLFYSKQLKNELQQRFKEDAHVEISMRYGAPSIAESWKNFRSIGIKKLYILPLYPHATFSSTETAIQAV